MDLTSQVLCNIVLSSIGLYFNHQSHPQLGVVFDWLLSFFLELFSPLFSSSTLDIYEVPGEFIFQCHIFLPFHTVHRVLKARILKWFAIPFSSELHSIRSLHHAIHLEWPYMPWLFHESDKAMIHVIRPQL